MPGDAQSIPPGEIARRIERFALAPAGPTRTLRLALLCIEAETRCATLLAASAILAHCKHLPCPTDHRLPTPIVRSFLTVVGEGYGPGAFRSDVVAAVTVAIVALPLSMAIAVASGVTPERGLYTAIVGGFLVSALGGSRYQVGGPAGAFVVLVSATVARFGIEGLLATVMLSGVMLTIIGVSRLGVLIRYIPHAVTVGFTCGIAATILASQLRDLGGLMLDGAGASE